MINAIQQLGLGVENKQAALDWFARVLGFRTLVFDEQNEAALMARYTGHQVCQRDAALVLNSHGGAGLEIWQHLSRKPLAQPEDMSLQSTGFLIGKLRCKGLDSIVAVLRQDSEPSLQLIGEITECPTGKSCYYFSVFGTWFQLIEDKLKNFRESKSWFCAGISGAIIGVSDMDSSLKFYRNVLGYNHIVHDQESKWPDWAGFHSRSKDNIGKFRRVVLQREQPEAGLYGELFGSGELELIEAKNKHLGDRLMEALNLNRNRHLYKDRRYWGDPGLIHLCFDVTDMSDLRFFCRNLGLDFTVDSAERAVKTFADDKLDEGFAVGETAVGRFAYLEDPDGSLIEFVETYRIPILRRLGISLNVRNRKKPLPRFLLKLASRDNYRKN